MDKLQFTNVQLKKCRGACPKCGGHDTIYRKTFKDDDILVCTFDCLFCCLKNFLEIYSPIGGDYIVTIYKKEEKE